MFYLVVLWVTLSLVISSRALDKKIGFRNAFVLSFLFSPIVGLIIIQLSKDHEEGVPVTTTPKEDKAPGPQEMEIM